MGSPGMMPWPSMVPTGHASSCCAGAGTAARKAKASAASVAGIFISTSSGEGGTPKDQKCSVSSTDNPKSSKKRRLAKREVLYFIDQFRILLSTLKVKLKKIKRNK